jgi:hypothetical protein
MSPLRFCFRPASYLVGRHLIGRYGQMLESISLSLSHTIYGASLRALHSTLHASKPGKVTNQLEGTDR